MNTNLMSKQKIKKDVFNSFLVKNAMYDGDDEIPMIKTSELLPENLISFSKAKNRCSVNSWIHFYENDSVFECLWNNPQRYLAVAKRFRGIISPDYSLYYDMPLAVQKSNTYRGKALANWFQKNGVEVIPNVRWGDERTFDIACRGVEHNKTIAVGTHGCIKTRREKSMFINGFDYILNELEPQNVVVYGRMPDKIFCMAKLKGVNLLHFESEFGLSRKKEAN